MIVEDMGCIPKFLIKEIREKMEIISNPENSYRCDLARQKRKINAIKKNAQIESYRIEHPNEQVPYCIPTHNRSTHEGIKNIENAFRWGESNFNTKDFDEFFIKNLAYRITPNLYRRKSNAEYRDSGVRISGSEFMPPYPWKVENVEMPKFVENLRNHFDNDDLIENMKTAIYAHFNLVRVHPFIDGNGRTSRALQDIILNYYGFPLPIINSGERGTYYNILENSVGGYKNRKGMDSRKTSDGEKSFYLYIAGKINTSLDKVLNCLNGSH